MFGDAKWKKGKMLISLKEYDSDFKGNIFKKTRKPKQESLCYQMFISFVTWLCQLCETFQGKFKVSGTYSNHICLPLSTNLSTEVSYKIITLLALESLYEVTCEVLEKAVFAPRWQIEQPCRIYQLIIKENLHVSQYAREVETENWGLESAEFQ